MAILFVDDGGSNTSPFDTWVKACTTGIQGAMADGACVAGSTIYVGHNSVATYGGDATYTNQGTFAEPVNVYSVTQGDETTYNIGAIEDASGGIWDLNVDGFVNVYGVHFKTGDNFQSAGTADNKAWQFFDCHIELTGISAVDTIAIVSANGMVWRLINTNLTFGAITQGLQLFAASTLEWFGGTLNTNINDLIEIHNNTGGYVKIRGVDLSVMTGAGTKFLFNGAGVTNEEPIYGEIIGCKLNAVNPPVLVRDVPVVDGVNLTMIGCGSAGVCSFAAHTFSKTVSIGS